MVGRRQRIEAAGHSERGKLVITKATLILRIQNILFPVDFSERCSADHSLEGYAAQEVRGLPSHKAQPAIENPRYGAIPSPVPQCPR
jgi:hypothetical protein